VEGLSVPLFDLTGKKAFITGASRGIGQAIAVALAGAGADLALVARSEDGLAETASDIAVLGRKAFVLPADVTSQQAVADVGHAGAVEGLAEHIGAGEPAHRGGQVRIGAAAVEDLAERRDAAVEPERVEALQRPVLGPGDLEADDAPAGPHDASQLARDRPYWVTDAGQQTNLVEVPGAWELCDTGHFLFMPAAHLTGMSSPSKVEEIWRGDFDGMYAEAGDVCYVLTMHPQIIGRLPGSLSRTAEYQRLHLALLSQAGPRSTERTLSRAN